MPALIGLFLRALAWALPGLGWHLLKGIGFGAVAFTGVSVALDQAKDFVFASLGSTSAEWLQLLGVLQIDVFINILFSAYVARAVLWGMNKSGSKTSMRWLGK